jgi:transcriptional regulator with XRE-family HTH domain
VDFADWLKGKMVDKDMTQAGLARATGRSTNVVSLWCQGKKRPGVTSVPLIAAALHITDTEVLHALHNVEVAPFTGLDANTTELISRLFGLPADFSPGEAELVRDLVFVIRRWYDKMQSREDIRTARRQGPRPTSRQESGASS